MQTGIELIAQERKEQIEKHGRTIELDVRDNNHKQLSDAAAMLCLAELDSFFNLPPTGWNQLIWEKMYRKPYKERLIIAGALIAAEIDRLNAMGK